MPDVKKSEEIMASEEQKKAGRRRRTRSAEEDEAMYAKIMIGFTIVQLALAMLLYISGAINTVGITVFTLGTAVLMVAVGLTWEKYKAMRILIRVLVYAALLFTAAMMVLEIGTFFLPENMEQLKHNVSTVLPLLLVYPCLFDQMVLLFLLPVLAMCAYHRRKLDLIMMRIVSAMELVLALVTVIYMADKGYIVWGIRNRYFDLFYALCVAVPLVTSFIIRPPQFKFLKRLMKKKAVADEVTAADEQAAVQGELTGHPEKTASADKNAVVEEHDTTVSCPENERLG